MAGFNPNDMELTPGLITIYPYGNIAASAGYALGATLSSIKVGIKTDKAHFMSDQTGSTPLDSAISGQQFTITTEIAQTRDYLLAASAVFPHAILLGNAPYDGTATEVSELDFSPSKQSTWKIVWTVYPDTANPYSASGTDYRFMMRGNTAIF